MAKRDRQVVSESQGYAILGASRKRALSPQSDVSRPHQRQCRDLVKLVTVPRPPIANSSERGLLVAERGRKVTRPCTHCARLGRMASNHFAEECLNITSNQRCKARRGRRLAELGRERQRRLTLQHERQPQQLRLQATPQVIGGAQSGSRHQVCHQTVLPVDTKEHKKEEVHSTIGDLPSPTSAGHTMQLHAPAQPAPMPSTEAKFIPTNYELVDAILSVTGGYLIGPQHISHVKSWLAQHRFHFGSDVASASYVPSLDLMQTLEYLLPELQFGVQYAVHPPWLIVQRLCIHSPIFHY